MEYIALVSRDGQRVVVPREAAMASGTLAGLAAFQGPTAGTSSSRGVVLDTVEQGALLEKAAEYIMYRAKYEGDESPPPFDIPTEMALELLVVADYLDL